MALGETARLLAELDLDDKFSGKLGRAGGALSGFQSRFGQVNRGIGQMAGGLDRLATRGALAAAGGLTAVIKTAVDFEDAFAGVRKTVDELDLERAGLSFDKLNERFREMARTIPLTFEELAGLGEAAGALGIAAGDIEEFTRVTALLGVTTDVSALDAATALGQLSNVLQLTGDDYDNFAASLVDLGNKGASTESQILEIATRAGAGAHLIGIANDQTLGWASAVANLGIEVEAGGTAIQKFFLESLRNLQDDDTLTVMAETAGTTGAAFKKAFEKDASGALTTFLKGLGELTQAEQLAVLEMLGFNDARITRTLLGLAGDTDNLTDALDTNRQAWAANTALTTEAEKRFATTASQIQLIKNNVRDAANTIGVELLPIVKDMTDEFLDWINLDSTQTGLKDFAKDLAEGIRGVVKELKGTDFSGLISGMKLAAEVARGAFDAFRALPAPIQQLAIAALIANKVSGGAVGQIAKGLVNIGGGLLTGGGLLGRGSSPANPLWVQSVGGIGGGAPGAGGKPGGLKLPPWVPGVGGLGLGTAAGVAALPVVLSGSEAGMGTQIDMLVQRLQKGVPIDKATEGITLGAINALLADPALQVGIPDSVLQQLDALDGKLGDFAGALDGATAAAGQFNPANPGGTRPPLSPVPPIVAAFMKGGLAALFPKSLPNTATDAGGGVVELPDTALSSLDEIATNTRPLAPIISKAEQASQTTARAVQDAKLAQIAGLNRLGEPIRTLASRTEAGTQTLAARMGELRAATVSSGATVAGTIRAKNFSPNISVRVTSNIAITDITRRLVSARVSTGTISEF